MTAATRTAVAVGDRSSSVLTNVGDLLQQNKFPISAMMASGTVGLVFAGLSTTPAAVGADRTSVDWARIDGVAPGDSASVDTVITRILQRDSAIEIDRHVQVRDSDGILLEEGLETWSAPWSVAVRSNAGTDVCTRRWGDALAESLLEDQSFADSLATWDGTLGLRCDDGSHRRREVHLRIYRGRIVDVSRRTPHGATFTFVADAVRWIELVTSARNEFMGRAIRGEFSSTGDGYEYLRLTKPLGIIIEHARTIAQEGDA